MKLSLRAFLTSMLLGIGLVASSAPAMAGGSPWNWTDISSQLATTANRPVWAMEYANGSWYYTDGIDLNAGGHVYRYDGATQVDITNDVRNAGLSRVDDIVSDGRAVLMLKNVVSTSNIVEVVKYESGTATNATSAFRNGLRSDEGVGFLTGKEGTWYLVTTKARLLTWSGATYSNFTEVALPSGAAGNVDLSKGSIAYSTKHGSPQDGRAGGVALSIVPTSDGWLLAAQTYSGVRLYKQTTQTYGTLGFTDITSLFGNYSYIDKIASNGSTALVFAGYSDSMRSYGTAGDIFTYANGIATKVSTGGYSTYVGAQISSASILADWTGMEWMIVSGKNVSAIVNGQLQTEPVTRDFFTSIASNGSGTTLLGGAVSTEGNNQPSYPLTAKLVKATDWLSSSSSGSAASVGTQSSTQNQQTSIWTWVDPNTTLLYQGQTATFNAGAWTANGMNKIEMYVNGSLRRTCTFSNAVGNQQCNVTITGSDAGSSQGLSLSARVMDVYGNSAWSNTQTVQTSTSYSYNYPYNYNYNYNYNTSYDISAWGTMDPTGSTLNRNASVTYHAQASATAGLSRMDVYANDAIARTCSFSNQTGTQSCDTVLYGYNYGSASQLNVHVLATDIYGHTTWSDTKSVTLVDTSTNNYCGTYYNQSCYPYTSYSSYPTYTTPAYTTNNNGSSWVWSSPDQTTLAQNASVTFNVGAWDPDGIQRIDVYANNVVANSCVLNNATGNQSCSATIYGGSYPASTSVNVNARIVDTYGNVFWSDSRSFAIQSVQPTTYATPVSYRNGYGYGYWKTGRWVRSNPPSAPASPVSSNNGNVSITTDHPNGYALGETVTFTATALNGSNDSKMQILVDGYLIKTCYNQSVCTATRVAGGQANAMMYGATLTDASSNVSWTGYVALNKR